ncbi:type II toxin-antitoxin system VapC family toxin [Crocosphaera sp. Alani8]|uniref:type II toxin-antitoxin system VapC family toxin n=1 Tax=Crocosphaera sp. Alani8 TaxID=3038952 RepID=UPI00313DDD78
MAKYLLDTNILLRASDPISSKYSLARDAIYLLLDQGHSCYCTPQTLIEFWVVATRPLEVNGLGWTTQRSQSQINQFLNRFPLLRDTPDIFEVWFQLVTTHQVKGKRTHDLRLLAVMKAHKISHLLTFNTDDFIFLQDITILRPQDIINSL